MQVEALLHELGEPAQVEGCRKAQHERGLDRCSGDQCSKSVAPLLEQAVLHGWASGLDENIDYGRLLGREANIADLELIAAMLREQTILVTGAGGTIGSAICQEVLKYKPKEIIWTKLDGFKPFTFRQI